MRRALTELSWSRVLGELLIVVVGVLIAVQLDRWVAGRQDAARAQEYMVRLASDLSANEAMLDSLALRGLRRTEAADSLLICMNGARCDLDAAAIRELVNTIRGGAQRSVRRATFADMLSTGSLALLEDRSLREDVIAYYEDFPVPQYPAVVQFVGDLIIPMFSLMGRHLDERVLNGPEDFRRTNPIFVTSWDQFAADEDVAAQLRLVSSATYSAAPFYQLMAESSRTLRARVEEASVGNDPSH